MATLHRHGNRHLIFVKGAPEKLLDICQECRFSEWENVPGVADHFAKEGLRVLGLAYKEVPVHQTEITMADLQTGLIFAGLQGMIDPPRPEAVDAVAGCKKAGIRVVKSPETTPSLPEAIAKKVGIVEEEEVVEDLAAKPVEAMTDEELFTVTKEVANVLAQHSGLDSRAPLDLTGNHVQALTDMEILRLPEGSTGNAGQTGRTGGSGASGPHRQRTGNLERCRPVSPGPKSLGLCPGRPTP